MKNDEKNIVDIGAGQPAGAQEPAAHETTPGTEESAVKDDVGVYTHTFKRPFAYCGVTYTELTFDFEHLTGRDMVAIDAEMQANGEMLMAAETSRSCQSKIAARAAGIGADVVEAMPLGDFNRITNAVRNFLIETGF